MSSIQSQIREQVSLAPEGRVFGYDALPSYRQAPVAVVKAISRLVEAGRVKNFQVKFLGVKMVEKEKDYLNTST